jgi:hypothetical protein
VSEEAAVLPGAEQAEASPEEQARIAEQTAKNRAIDEADNEGEKPAEGEKPKVEKTPEQKSIERLERKLGRVIGQREEARAERAHLLAQIERLQSRSDDGTNRADGADSETLSLTRAELRAAIEAEAKRLAPTIKGRDDEAQRRRDVVGGLVKAWGQDAFTERTNDLAEVFDGNKQLLVLETENPAALIEYLTDDDNAAQAESIARMSIGRAGYELAKIAAKLEASKAQAKPKESKAPKPVEAIRGSGSAGTSLVGLSDREFNERRRRQVAARR